MADFLMPALGADMETGTVVQWLVKPGDRVKPGDVVAVVETHKGAIDVEIFLDGVIDHLAALGAALPVGAVLAQVQVADGAPAGTTTAPAPARPAQSVPAVTHQGPRIQATGGPSRQRVSPAARQRAQQLGVKLSGLQGSGADGAVTLIDIEAARAKAGAPQQRSAAFDPAQMRKAIAAAMSRSKREIPHYYLADTMDFSAAHDWLQDWNRDRAPEQRLLEAALLLKATALALRGVPQFNGLYEQGSFSAGTGIHIGWAIALRGGGLIAPAIHDADRLTLPELMAALRDLVQRARAGGLRSSEMSDPTVTVTSLGERGAESVLGVIYPPQVAIIGFGRVLQRPWVVDGQVVARHVVKASLAADHRVSDGHLGGKLLRSIDQALQSPATL
ncbi:dihydrolipoamide acetyltransferase family protein [Roseateles toxinivorans]|uniref:Dihydrolipoamide acetyltransferase component of pyruvate dehydrogenase complex n=1 Tax=Roseateles toxinivorans TaxID=270368 RepID=A0A4R6QK56_9BURK|nr:dihydrolipoamide acetyltransferase family protein [Roseateles toxinivorans]TDP64126.1 pyruvate dehydrogenase E2 component (dihydrolipoamide acetyltransferase) [Roseateles toxinivorans]